jgi:hypothetical protein
MKLRAKRILVALDRIGELQEEKILLENANSDNPIFKNLQQKKLFELDAEAESLRQQIEVDMKLFRDRPTFEAFKTKILDSQRKKVRGYIMFSIFQASNARFFQRQKRARNQMANEIRREDERLRPTMHRLVDDWLVAEAAVVEQKEIDEENKEREQQRTMRKEKKERQRRELAMLIVKLEQLRRVRMKRQVLSEGRHFEFSILNIQSLC